MLTINTEGWAPPGQRRGLVLKTITRSFSLQLPFQKVGPASHTAQAQGISLTQNTHSSPRCSPVDFFFF